MIRRVAVIATTLFFVTAGGTIAAPISYSFTATVTKIGSTPTAGISLGEDIPISFTVTIPAGETGPTYTNTAGVNNLFTSATFNGTPAVGLFQTINVSANSFIEFSSNTPMTEFGFDFKLSGPKNGVLSSGTLPAMLNAADFTSGTFIVERVSEDDQSYAGTIDLKPQSVPEPASWLLLLGAGLYGLGWKTARGSSDTRVG